mgnify:CR=1 FL=1
MAEKLLKVGIIGCGRMGLFTDPVVKSTCPKCYLPYSHADAVSIHPNLKLSGLCDISDHALEKAKQIFPEVPVFKNPEKLLKDISPDLICIATRTPERFALIKLCIENGIRLIHVEKPLCNSYDQLLRISKLIDINNVHFTFGAIRRYLAPYKTSIEFFNKGLIGDLEEVSFNLGSTLLCWDHIHGIDLISSILKPFKIKSIRAVAKNIFNTVLESNTLDIDPEIAFIHFSTYEGPQGMISCAGGGDLMIYGKKGIIGVLNDGMKCFYRKSTDENNPKSYFTETVEINVPESIYTGTAAAIDRLVKTDSKLAKLDSKSMINSQKLLFACVQSILTNGDPVDPENIREDLCIKGKFGELYA